MAFASIKHKKRLTILLVAAMLGFVVVIGRLFYVQIIKGDYYEELAYKQQTKDRTVEASRGTIYDSAGNILAISVSSNTLTIAPTNIPDEDKANIADEFAKILEMDADAILAKLNKKVSLVTIASNIEKEKAVKISSYISQNEIKGAYLDESTTRAYPYGSLLSHVYFTSFRLINGNPSGHIQSSGNTTSPLTPSTCAAPISFVASVRSRRR